ncbi:hypothetical protein E1263_03865 [Kribbella antibiotica]|uniref:HEAT repeat domain-containing protein n=1 Tax=Kribbella antibiotica TaxID=190195 RepID=A0A4R4ZTY1_9ACTN|nr:hypothetical protein [Kribbella antibiotica]TDD62305.1 hypothetical protein E1263_03865 [Kribbella antibiotica]
MTPTEVDAALEGLRAACLGADDEARAKGLVWLAQLSPVEVLLLSERGRRMYWWWYSEAWGGTPFWSDALGRGDLLTECVASLHANGYVREHAVRLLADREGGVGARCLALRAVDHVSQVREPALKALVERPDVVALGVLLRLRNRFHGPAALTSYGERFEARELLASPDLVVRRFAYDGVLAEMASGEIGEQLEVETDQWSRRRLVERWMAVDPVVAKERLLGSRYVEGRLMVLYDGSDELFERDELEERMLDRSSRVRAAACWRYRRAGHEPAPYYRAAWEEDGAAEALAGLHETGQRFGAAEAQEALASSDSRLRLAALQMWPPERPSKQLLLTLLADPSGAVVRYAARLLATTPGIRYDDVSAAAASEHANQRRAAWRLRRELGGWNRVRADLEVRQDADEELMNAGRQDLHSWLMHHAATTYQPLGTADREAIRAHLDRADLPRDVEDRLRFLTGTR